MGGMKKRNESSIVTAILRYLQVQENSKKIEYVDRCNSGIVFCGNRRIRLHREGFPDILVILKNTTGRSRFIFIECKIGKNQLSDGQKNFKEMVERAGHIYIIARQLDDILNLKIYE